MKKNLYYLKFPFTLKVLVLQTFIVLMAATVTFAQTILIKGKVTDAATNEPVPGVSVTVKGTTTAVATDVNGNYSISAGNTAILVFKFLGYAPQEVPAG